MCNLLRVPENSLVFVKWHYAALSHSAVSAVSVQIAYFALQTSCLIEWYSNYIW